MLPAKHALGIAEIDIADVDALITEAVVLTF
jgi:hypothetical protein